MYKAIFETPEHFLDPAKNIDEYFISLVFGNSAVNDEIF